MATSSPAPAPTSRPLQEGLLPRWPRAGGCRRWSFGKDAPGQGRACPSLAPHGRDPLALFGISENRCSPTFAGPHTAPGTVPHALRRTRPSSKASSWPQACIRPAGRHLPRGSGLLPARAPRSFLVVIGGVGKGELQAVGLGQQQADVPVTPLGCGQVLQEEQQLLKISFF